MTRKRTRENLVQTLCEPCTHCEGRGYLLSDETVTYNLLREVRNSLPRFSGRRIAITVAPRVAEQLLGSEAKSLAELSDALGEEIEVRARPGIHQEQFEVEALGEGPGVTIPLRWLRDPAEIAAEEDARSKERGSSRGAGGRGSRRRGRGSRRGRDEADEPETPDGEAESADAAGEGPSTQTPEAEAEAEPSPDSMLGTDPAPGGMSFLESAGESESPGAVEPMSGLPGAPAETPEADERAEDPAQDPQPTTAPAPADPAAAALEKNPGEDPQPLDDEAESRILPRS